MYIHIYNNIYIVKLYVYIIYTYMIWNMQLIEHVDGTNPQKVPSNVLPRVIQTPPPVPPLTVSSSITWKITSLSELEGEQKRDGDWSKAYDVHWLKN